VVDACDCTPDDVAVMLEDGATAFVCDSAASARRVLRTAGDRGAVAAVGYSCGPNCSRSEVSPCTGYFVDCRQVAESVLQLLRNPPLRPAAVWLVGAFVDRDTLGPAGMAAEGGPLCEHNGTRSFQLEHLLL
jgi:hypothetical protein